VTNSAGWLVADPAQFLQLSEEERAFLELKPGLASGWRELRERRGLTQAALAERLGSESIARGQDGGRRPLCVTWPDDAAAINHRNQGYW